MSELIKRLRWAGGHNESLTDMERLLTREWLVTNGLGGYASGSVSGVISRRFHGLLISALPAPFGRYMMFNNLIEQVRLPDGRTVRLGGEEKGGSVELHGCNYLTEFRLELGLPVWRYEVEGITLEKQILLPHLQNTVHIRYRLVGGEPVRLELSPTVHFRPHEGLVDGEIKHPYMLTVIEDRYELSEGAGSKLPPLRMLLYGENAAFTFRRKIIPDLVYRIEAWRGYDFKGSLWSPGFFHMDLSEHKGATLVASAESWETIHALEPDRALGTERERRQSLLAAAHPEAQTGVGGQLALAADQFIITPAGRVEDAARAHAAGDAVRTVIAGYHWFTDWGRDTMISLEGLTLTTGRHTEAGWILRTFAHYIRDGLIPNMFPEGENHGLYHTADATLWFFHALDRYVEVTGDRATLALVLPKLVNIVEHHFKGTRFGIGVDPKTGLLIQGEQGYQLTWMDAKVGDWVVTPRRGKAVEIQALWYNALRLLEGWSREEEGGEFAGQLAEHAERTRRSFNERFWYAEGGYLYDVIDGENGDDPACRPNQVFAISLKHPVLDPARWGQVLEVVSQRLLTPVGLRSLAPGHPDYKQNYEGDLRSRDAAYHQGTVWSWLIGPFIDAWLKVHEGDRGGARRFLEGLVPHLDEACIGSVSEIFDAESPFTPRGCVAQAWSVAEMLRCWAKTGSIPFSPV